MKKHSASVGQAASIPPSRSSENDDSSRRVLAAEDKRVVIDCAAMPDRREAVKVFCRRFHRCIHLHIVRLLEKFGDPTDEDTIADVCAAIWEKLLSGNLMEQLAAADSVRAYLGGTVRHLLIDRRRRRHQQRDAYGQLVEATMQSMEAPVQGTESLTIGETLPAPDPLSPEITRHLRRIAAAIGDLDDRYALVLRIAVMFYEPLSEAVLDQLARRRGVDGGQIRREVEEVEADLLRRYEELIACRNRAYVLWAVALRLQRRHRAISAEGSDPETVAALEDKIAEIQDQRERLLKKHGKLLRPRSRQIAHLTGIPAARAATVNVLLHRARKALAANCNPETVRRFSQ